MIVIKSKYTKWQDIRREYSNPVIIDVTSKATDDFVRLSPFYPHGRIPVPFSPGTTAMSVESVWQGLKVFQNADIDTSLFHNGLMHGIKRTAARFGQPLGHRKGVRGTELLDYVSARRLIYVPTYRWILENKANDIVERIRLISRTHTVVLLDYNTNPDVEDTSSPLSHAALIKQYIESK